MPGFSRTQKKLASYFIKKWDQMPIISITDISNETGVSTASISRFTHQFGFKGYYQFKNKIKSELKKTIDPFEHFKLLDNKIAGKKSLSKVAEQDVHNINQLINMTDESSFLKIVSMIEEADRIYTFGASISSVFANLIRYIFNQVKKETHCLDEGNMAPEERILRLGKKDLVIFLSFFHYSKSTIEYAQLAHELGLKVISISDDKYSPISEYSDFVLPIPRENVLFTTSMSAFSVLINSIATEMAVKDKDKISKNLKIERQKLKKFYFLK